MAPRYVDDSWFNSEIPYEDDEALSAMEKELKELIYEFVLRDILNVNVNNTDDEEDDDDNDDDEDEDDDEDDNDNDPNDNNEEEEFDEVMVAYVDQY